MINKGFLDKLGESQPYRICCHKIITGLSAASSQVDSGTFVIDVPFRYYSIEKTSFNYNVVDVSGDLIYCVTELWYLIHPGAKPVFNHLFARDSLSPLTNTKYFIKYSRQGATPDGYYFNCVFDNSNYGIDWDFKMTFGSAVTGDLNYWIEISGQYFE
jgi:hypothetical protein